MALLKGFLASGVIQNLFRSEVIDMCRGRIFLNKCNLAAVSNIKPTFIEAYVNMT